MRKPFRSIGILAMSAALLWGVSEAQAQPQFWSYARGAGGPFSLGVILGDPTGASAKYFYTGTMAVDFALGFGFSHHEGMQVHVDHLWHPHVLTRTEYFKLPWYVGAGGFFSVGNDHHRNPDHVHRADTGFRIPVGLAFAFEKVAMDAFIEFAPGAGFITHPGFRFDVGIGTRYYF